MNKKDRQILLNKDQQQLQQLLLDYELEIFTIKELREKQEFTGLDLQHSLEVLVKTNFLNRIEKGKYCLFNFRDELVIGNYLAQKGTVGYWSALNQHGLTEQFPNAVFVQTTKIKKNKTVFGVQYRFVKVLPRKMIGVIKLGHGNHQYSITDPEKTIVDCFDLPQYSGGWAELMRAVAEATFEQEKLIKYCQAINNIAATKRLAFLIELLGKTGMDDFLTFAQSVVRKKYNRFDPFGREEGKFNSRWKLRLNISQKDILNVVGKTY